MEPEAKRDIRGGKGGEHLVRAGTIRSSKASSSMIARAARITSMTTRVKSDYLLVGLAARTETDCGEMSLARAAGAGNRVG